MAPVRLLQWNSYSACAKKHELITIVNLYNPVIIANSEIWLQSDAPAQVSDLLLFERYRSDGIPYPISSLFLS